MVKAPFTQYRFLKENGTKSCCFGLRFALKRFFNRHQMKTHETQHETFRCKGLKTASFCYGFKGRHIFPLSLFESITVLYRFQTFTLKRSVPFSNRHVSKIVFILCQLRQRFEVSGRPTRYDFVPFSFGNGMVYTRPKNFDTCRFGVCSKETMDVGVLYFKRAG